MPLIMSPDSGGTVQVRRAVTFTSSTPKSLTRHAVFVTRPVSRVRRHVTFTANRVRALGRLTVWSSTPSLARVARHVNWPASRLAQLRRTVSFATPANAPVTLRPGIQARQTILTSNAGPVISAQYSHSGTRESMNVTVPGRVTPQGQISLQVSDSGRSLSLSLDADLNQYETRSTPTGDVTTLHAFNRAASRLGSVRLPELIPWKLSPTPKPGRRVPCVSRPKPQEIAVNDVLSIAFQAAGMQLSSANQPDPFPGVMWKEGEREYLTLGKTPDQVFADTLGQLGWRYMVRGKIAYAVPTGGGFKDDSASRDDLIGELNLRAEAGSTPSLATLTGADLLVDKPSLIALLVEAPDAASLQRELLPTLDWYVDQNTSGGEVIKGFRKVLGRITGTAELTLSSVTVQETVNNALESRTFSRVVTGFTSTLSSYDPDCPDAMLRQRTVKQSYGYALNTTTHSGIFSGPGFIGGYEAGDPLGDEEQTILQAFSPEGYLSSRTTITKKLTSVQQLNADAAPAVRGPLVAREYLTQILSEAFQPIGGGQWLRTWSLSGGQQLPLYDTASGDAVRLATRGGTLSSGQEPMDAAPTQVRCPDPCAAQKVAYPQVLRRSLPDGREGQEVSRTLNMVNSLAALGGYMDTIAASLGPSLSTDAAVSTLHDWRPGVKLAGSLNGVVESFSLDAAAGMANIKISVRELLRVISTEAGVPPGNRVYRDQALWRLPGGIVVNHLKEVKDSVPIFVRIFVRATGANLPSPGDEVEWRDDARFGPTATGNYGN